LNTEEARTAIRKLKSFGFKHLHLLGGEPLLRPDIIELVSFANSLGMKVTINTNGIMLAQYDFAKRLIEAGVPQITISLDGAKEETNDIIRGKGVFKKVIQALNILNKLREEGYKVEIGIAFTMTKINLDEMPQVVELAHEYRVDVVDFMSLYVSGNAIKHLKELEYTTKEALDKLEQLAEFLSRNRNRYKSILIQLDIWYPTAIYLERKYRVGLRCHPRNMGCMAVVDRIYMDTYGNLHPCGITTNGLYNKEVLRDKQLIIQNINILYVNSLEEIIRGKYFLSFLKLRANKNIYLNKEPCRACDYFEMCVPCPIINYPRKIIEECAETFKREKEFEDSVLSSFIKLHKDKILVNGNRISVYDSYHQAYRVANDMASQIIELLLNKENDMTVKEIIIEVKKNCNQISDRQLERDVIDFIQYLKVLGVVKLTNEG
jgi:radical SAM protein with 4Fe4S-binding SPASM domain